MSLRRTCKEVTRLVFEGEDRAWTPLERLSLRLHWWACKRCRAFRRQADFMHLAMDRWRGYRDEG